MPHRRELKGVAHNFLGTFTSRYSDYGGWWVFGLAETQLAGTKFDLLGEQAPAANEPLSAARQIARSRFAEQLAKAKIPSSFVREAHLSISGLPELSRGQINGRWCEGHTFTFAVRILSDRGKTFEEEASIFVAPHDATTELRGTRAANQSRQPSAGPPMSRF
jgi:hypothetical protein